MFAQLLSTITPDMANATVIARFFNEGEGRKPLADFVKEMKALTDDDKQMLADGIRNGSLTY